MVSLNGVNNNKLRKVKIRRLNMEKTTQNRRTQFLTNRYVIFLGAMICCALWGSAFPFVKRGIDLMKLSKSDTAGLILFAGERFTLAGIFIIILGSIFSKNILVPKTSEIKDVIILCIFQSVGQYTFYYIGIAHTSGVNTSIVDSLAYFLSIISACIIFRLEKMTTKKFLGCILGFTGVILVNVTGNGFDFNMTCIGEGMILLSAVSYSFSSVLAKIFSKKDNPVMLSGYQFVLGGIIMLLGSLVAGARFRPFTGKALAVLIYLAFISTFAYSLWTILLKYNEVSKVSIYGFLNPVFGVILSALILGETNEIGLNYIIALVIISIGITIVNKKTE